MTSLLGYAILLTRKLGKERFCSMDKEKILESSRKENKNRDLVELEVAARAGHIAGRVGAAVCVLLSLVVHLLTGSYLLSPWIIYFSIIATHSLVKYVKLRRKTDLVLSFVYLAVCLSFLVLFVLRLVEVNG